MLMPADGKTLRRLPALDGADATIEKKTAISFQESRRSWE